MKKTLLVLSAALVASFASAQTTLGSVTFVDSLFGDTLVESDGGTHSGSNYLNTTNANPGNPGYLTGVGFETGVANIGLGGNPTYTIGYNSGIANGAGDDFGIVVARYSTDNVRFRLSTDGVNFGAWQFADAGVFVDSGETRNYFYNGGGPFSATLYYATFDLADFGFGASDVLKAIEIGTGEGSTELDLIRVAGMNAVPEPGTMTILGLGALAAWRKRKAQANKA